MGGGGAVSGFGNGLNGKRICSIRSENLYCGKSSTLALKSSWPSSPRAGLQVDSRPGCPRDRGFEQRKVDPADERRIRSIRSENPLTAPTDTARARLAVQTHLARIALHRPLNQIADPTERAAAERARTWFDKEFLNVLVD